MKKKLLLLAVMMAAALSLSPMLSFAVEDDADADGSAGVTAETLASESTAEAGEDEALEGEAAGELAQDVDPDAAVPATDLEATTDDPEPVAAEVPAEEPALEALGASEQPDEEVVALSTSYVTAIYFTFDGSVSVGAVAPTTVNVTSEPAGAVSTSTLGVTWEIVGTYENGNLTMQDDTLAPGGTFQAGCFYYPVFDEPVMNDGFLLRDNTTEFYINGVLMGTYTQYASAGNRIPGHYYGPLIAGATTPVIGYDLAVDEPVVGATPDTTATVVFTTANDTVAGTQEISVAWMEYETTDPEEEGTLLGAGDTFKAGKYYLVSDVYEVSYSPYILYAGAFNALPAGLYYDLGELDNDVKLVNGVPRDFFGPLEGQENYELTYEYDSDNQTATVTGFTGEAGGALTIPETVTYEGTSYTVTAIKNSAFSGKTGFTGALTIPGTVTTIGSSAFYGCSNLSGTLTIPASVTSIGNNAFQQCAGLTALEFEDGSAPLAIGTCAFYSCSSLAGTLTIPARATSIGQEAFRYCKAFTSLVFEADSQLEAINTRAFDNCTGLTGNLALPDSVTAIGQYAFNNCNKLDGTLTLPSNLETIGTQAFCNCKFTGDLVVPGTITSFADSAFQQAGFTGKLVLGEGLTTVGKRAFNATTFQQPLELPSTMTTIPEQAFYGCGMGGDLVIPESVTAIGDMAFWSFGTSGVTGSLTLPNTLTTIGNSAFRESKFTGALTLPDNVTSVGEYAFCDCAGLTSLQLSKNEAFTVIPKFAFGSSSTDSWSPTNMGFTGVLTIPANVRTIDQYAFNRCVSLQGLGFESGTTTIGDYAFAYCGNTGTLTLPNTLESIGNYAFSYSGFTGDLIIPDTVTSLGEFAFFYCKGFNGALHFPDNASMTSVPKSVFRECENLVGPLQLPDRVKEVGYGAFDSCQKLQATITGDGNVLDGIETIGDYAFTYCLALEGTLTIPSSVTYLGKSAFSSCNGITALDMHQQDTVLREQVFYCCEGLTDMGNIPSSVTTIEDGTFRRCFALVGDVAIPEGVETIGSLVFCDCHNLTGTVTIPSTATSIDSMALYASHFTGIVNNSDLELNVSGIAGANEHFVDDTGATVTTIGKGTYTRVAGAALVDISGATVTGIAGKTYNGKAQTQSPKVVVGGTTLTAGTHYTLSYKNNTNAGTATVTMTGVESAGYTGSISKTFKIAKAANLLTVKAKTVTAKAKKKTTVKTAKAFAVSKAQGKVTYKKAKGDKKVSVSSAGKVTVKKGLKKGKTYKVTVKVTAAGNGNYNAKTVTVTLKVKVK